MKLRLRKYLLKFEPLPWRQPLIRVSFILTALFFIATLFLLVARLLPISQGRDLIALHYNVYVGVDRVGIWSSVLFLPAVGFVAGLVNFLAASFVFVHERTLSYFLIVGTVLIELIIAVASLLIVLVNL